MRLFRIAPKKFGADLSGTGARLFGSRWTPKGVPAVYTSDSAPLAALEVLVHQPFDLVPGHLVLLEVDVPDDLTMEGVELSRLDRDWDAFPFRISTVKVGGEWAHRNKTAALKVPSAIVPYGKGWNVILNPMNKEFSRVKVIGMAQFSFDKRLLRR
jgi:RES domain-containing protein